MHSLKLRAEYEEAKKSGKDYPYEEDLAHYLRGWVRDCDREVEAGKRKLDETQPKPPGAGDDPLDKEIKALEEKATALGTSPAVYWTICGSA